MGFDLLFYGGLLFSSTASFYILRSNRAAHFGLRALKATALLLTVLLWAWQIGLLLVPKGLKWHEVLRLPRHFWVLNHQPPLDDLPLQTIAYGNHPRQYYHYYPAPTHSTKRDQVIVYWHGGGWTMGHPAQHQYLAQLLHRQGYTLIFPAYRLMPQAGFEHMQADVDSALLHSLAFLERQGIVAPTLILGGTSAGGNLATLLAYDEARWAALGLEREGRLAGVFSIAGALDLDKMESTFALRRYAAAPDDQTFLRANAKHCINAADRFPFLCLHGDKDGLVDYEAAHSFCATIRLYCPDCVDFRTFNNMTHLQVGAMWYYCPHLLQGQDQALVQWLDRLPATPSLGYLETNLEPSN